MIIIRFKNGKTDQYVIWFNILSSLFNTDNLIWSTSDKALETNFGFVESGSGLTKSSLAKLDMMIDVLGDGDDRDNDEDLESDILEELGWID